MDDRLTVVDLPLSPFPLPRDWEGRFHVYGGASANGLRRLTPDDIDEVIASGVSSNADNTGGMVAAVLRVKDGRYIAYDTFYNLSCDGFRAYGFGGGQAGLTIAMSLETVVCGGLTTSGRLLCGFPEDWGYTCDD